MSTTTMNLPQIVSPAEWQAAHEELLAAPGVESWPTAGCPGCSMFADQIGHLAHLHARDTSFVLVSRAPLANLETYDVQAGHGLDDGRSVEALGSVWTFLDLTPLGR